MIADIHPNEGEPLDFWVELDRIRADWDVLKHPFYLRWSAGELDRVDLARYASEHYHSVVGLADAAKGAAGAADDLDTRKELEAHAAEERSHIELYVGFLRELQTSPSTTPLPETERCRETWVGTRERPLPSSLAALYVIESSQARVADVKLDGLKRHYGFEDGPGTAYFELHAEIDHSHAAMSRRMLEQVRGGSAEALEAAEQVAEATWRLLDGVERERPAVH